MSQMPKLYSISELGHSPPAEISGKSGHFCYATALAGLCARRKTVAEQAGMVQNQARSAGW